MFSHKEYKILNVKSWHDRHGIKYTEIWIQLNNKKEHCLELRGSSFKARAGHSIAVVSYNKQPCALYNLNTGSIISFMEEGFDYNFQEEKFKTPKKIKAIYFLIAILLYMIGGPALFIAGIIVMYFYSLWKKKGSKMGCILQSAEKYIKNQQNQKMC